MINSLSFLIIYFLLNKICLKFNFLIDKKDISDHKKKVITESKTPLTGGLIFIFYFISISFHENHLLLICLITLYVTGLMSDINFLSSPIKRILLQSLVIFIFVLNSNLTIQTLSLDILDELLKFKIVNILFIVICFLVLINGFNFLDGINTLVISNFLICFLSLYYVSTEFNLSLDFIFIKSLIIILSIIFIFNFFGKSFLGDSGTYTISFLVGFICVNFAYENYLFVSPYFIACLLWYPALENLFSIIRRFFSKKKLSKADNNHLHHCLYLNIQRNKFLKKKLYSNTFTGLLINLYMVFSAFLATLFYNHTQTLILIILLNIFVYLFLYFLLNKKKLVEF
tara:strand:- start:1628 stop:2653 length:1026 start_codon:yes stop_codon:yes gene_type:complete